MFTASGCATFPGPGVAMVFTVTFYEGTTPLDNAIIQTNLGGNGWSIGAGMVPSNATTWKIEGYYINASNEAILIDSAEGAVVAPA